MSRQDREWTVQQEEPDGSWKDIYWTNDEAYALDYALTMATKMNRRSRVRSSRELIEIEERSV